MFTCFKKIAAREATLRFVKVRLTHHDESTLGISMEKAILLWHYIAMQRHSL